MSTHKQQDIKKITTHQLQEMKHRGEKISMLTAYDYSMAKIIDGAGIDVILVGDLVDTAGTLCRAADILIKKGARSVRALCTHPILSGKAYENIEASQLEKIIVCDTIPLKRESEKIEVLSTAKLFARAIRNTHEHRSISSLFLK